MFNLNTNIDPNDIATWSTSLKVIAGLTIVAGIILFVVTMIWFVTWIKYSLFNRDNSANLSGGELAHKYLMKNGINANRIKFKGLGAINNIIVEPKFFYLRPYLINNGNFTLRLLPWTYQRRSIYTMAMAMESAWAVSSSKSSRFNSFAWDYSRKIGIFVVLLPLILGILFALAPVTGWSAFAVKNSNTISIVLSILGSILLIIYLTMQIFFYAKSRKEICQNLVGILNEREIRAINWIFKIKFIYYIIRTIYEVLQLILRIMMYVQSEQR